MEHFEAVLAGDEKVYFADGKSELLALCRDYSGLVCEYPDNKIAHIDFDGDGGDELIVRSMGEHILQYDFEDEKIYAIHIPSADGYDYYSIGVLTRKHGGKTEKYGFSALSKGSMELYEYTRNVSDNDAPDWTDIEFPDLTEN